MAGKTCASCKHFGGQDGGAVVVLDCVHAGPSENARRAFGRGCSFYSARRYYVYTQHAGGIDPRPLYFSGAYSETEALHAAAALGAADGPGGCRCVAVYDADQGAKISYQQASADRDAGRVFYTVN